MRSDQEATIRPLCEEDTDAIVALYERAASVEPGLGPVPRATWQHFIKLPQNQGCRDFRVADRHGTLIGLAESSLKDQGQRRVRSFKLVVDPAVRRQGVGSALLIDLLAIDQSSADLSLQALASPDWHAGIAFLSALGFAHIESEIGMRCQRLTPTDTGPPPGIVIERASDISHSAADIARIQNAAFASDVSFQRVTPHEKALELERGELWIASDRDRVLGFCHLESEEDRVWLENIAIDPGHQANGYGTALAYRALLANGVCPQHPAQLNVSSKNLAALSIYERLGFERYREKYRYSVPHGELVATMRGR